MPGGASKLHDVRKLADARSTLELDIPVAELPDLPAELLSSQAALRVRVQFGREQGRIAAHVSLGGQLQMICQRCMQPMPLPIDAHSDVLLLESEAEAEGAPDEWETYLASEGRVNIAALAAEELLLALPIVPLHAQDCVQQPASSAQQPAPTEEAATTRPFADLRVLLQTGDARKDG